jgi:hypothetical protein
LAIDVNLFPIDTICSLKVHFPVLQHALRDSELTECNFVQLIIASLLRVFVRVYVKLAMETFAQIEKGHAIDMKKVSATGTYAKS